MAMKSAVRQLYPKPELALIDGNRVTDFGVKAIPIIKGDAKVASIAAASILAKVARDQYMEAVTRFILSMALPSIKAMARNVIMQLSRGMGCVPFTEEHF